jgi:hypothetical protein
MKHVLNLVAALAAVFFVATTAAEAASCPRGQLTCGALCDLMAPDPHACKFASRDSCMTRFGNIRHCVGRNADNAGREGRRGGCRNGQIQCSAWCDKYAEDVRGCKFTLPGSCTRKHGSVHSCVRDVPPRG